VLRLQVPATPDPYDDATSDAHRQAVLDLLPPRTTPADEEPEAVEPETVEPEAREPEAVDPDTEERTDPVAEPVPAKAVAAETS
jgi:hypothetical protein